MLVDPVVLFRKKALPTESFQHFDFPTLRYWAAHSPKLVIREISTPVLLVTVIVSMRFRADPIPKENLALALSVTANLNSRKLVFQLINEFPDSKIMVIVEPGPAFPELVAAYETVERCSARAALDGSLNIYRLSAQP